MQKKGKMLKSESENKIELKRRDMRRTRKKLNTLTNDQLVFGTSLCILERFIHMIHLYIFAHIPCSAYSMLRRDKVEVPLFMSQCIEKVTHRQGSFLLDYKDFHLISGLLSSQLMASTGYVGLTAMCK